jgi:hypothetical protein
VRPGNGGRKRGNRGGSGATYRRKNSDEWQPEWTLGEGNSVWARGLAEEWLVRRIEVGRLKLPCAHRALGEMSLARPIRGGSRCAQAQRLRLVGTLHSARGKADDRGGKTGVGEGTAALSASVRSGARCRAAQQAWEGGRRGPSAEWRGSVERRAGRSVPVGRISVGTAGRAVVGGGARSRAARRGIGDGGGACHVGRRTRVRGRLAAAWAWRLRGLGRVSGRRVGNGSGPVWG